MGKLGTSGLRHLAGVSAIALAALATGGSLDIWQTGFVAPALAQSHDDEGGHSGGSGRGSGGHDDGHEDDGHEDDGHEGGSGGRGGGHEGGAGGEGQGGQGQGGQAGRGEGRGEGQGGQGSNGRPVWAGEGIPEVELGRLNVARSPDHVLDRAFTEAIASLTPAAISFYNQSLDGMIADLSQNWDTISIIDSPLQNLSLLRDALDGSSSLGSVGVGTDAGTLMAAFLGTASDKSIPISPETALAVSIILERPLSAAQAAALAAEAERIRQAIVAGHG